MKCSRCDNPRRPGGRYCNECHAAYIREWRAANPMTEQQRMKDNARSYAHVYLRRGVITRQPCEVCGERAEMHHPDYSKPLEIVWLCREHHLDLHLSRIA